MLRVRTLGAMLAAKVDSNKDIKMRIVTGLLALSLVSQPIFASTGVNNFISDVARTIQYVEKNRDAVWPGFSMSDMPIVIDMLSERGIDSLYAFNMQKRNLPWQTLRFDNSDVLFLAKNKINRDLYQFSGKVVPIDSQPSFISVQFKEDINVDKNYMDYLTLEKSSFYLQNQSTIAKEHLAQLGIDYDGFYDIENMKLTYLENAALSAYITGKGAVREMALRDAAAIDKYRTNRLSSEFKEFQRANDIYFGLPAYISLQAKNLVENNYIFKSFQMGCMPLSANVDFEGLYNCDMLNGPSFRAAIFGRALTEKLSSYAWKSNVEKEFKTLGEVVQEYYQLNDEQAKTLTDAAKHNASYNYPRISAVVRDIMQPTINTFNKALNAYDHTQGFELYSPWVILDLFSFDPLDPNIDIFHDTTNKLLRLNLDGEGELEGYCEINFNHLPYAFNQLKFNQQHEIDDINSWTIFKIQKNTILILDGQQINIAEFIKSKSVRNFQHLNIRDQHVKIQTKTSGRLDASNGSLRLYIDGIYDHHMKQAIVHSSKQSR